MLEQYPTLHKVIALLTSEGEPPTLSEPLPPVDTEKGDRVVGELTIGERHFLAFLDQEQAALKAIFEKFTSEDREPSDEENRRMEVFDDLTKVLWDNIRERIGDPETDITVCEGWQLVAPLHDCGCGNGLQCFKVRAGIIDPMTGAKDMDPEKIAKLKELMLEAGVPSFVLNAVSFGNDSSEFLGILGKLGALAGLDDEDQELLQEVAKDELRPGL